MNRSVTLRETASRASSARVLITGDLFVKSQRRTLAESVPAPWAAMSEFITQHDMSIVNLECPLTSTYAPIAKWGPHLRGDVEVAAMLRDGGFKLAALANNHVLDMGGVGVMDTLRALDDAGVGHVGVGLDIEEAERPVVLNLNGVSLGIMAMAESEFSIATAARPGAAPLDLAHALRRLRSLRDEVDVVLALLHGGCEYFPLPTPRMQSVCRALVDAGVGCVVCSHTHVVAPFEVYHHAPIVYGTGNFLFQWGHAHDAEWRRGLVVTLHMDRVGVAAFDLTPVQQSDSCADVSVMADGDAMDFWSDYDSLAETLAESAMYDERWQSFCRGQRPLYLASLLGMGRLGRALLRQGPWPVWRRRSSLPRVLNHVRCESHRDVAIEVLEAELRGWQ